MEPRLRDENGAALEKWAGVVDDFGRRYWVASVGRAGSSDCVFLLPMSMVVAVASEDGTVHGLKCAQTAKPSVSNATSSVATPTASMVRDLLSEADAILTDSSDSSTERRSDSLTSLKPGSSSSFASSKSPKSTFGIWGTDFSKGNPNFAESSKKLSKMLFALSAILLSIAIGVILGRL